MDLLVLFRKLSRWPFGKLVFSQLFCMKAPYFGSISPRFQELEAGKCVGTMRKRHGVTNHIGSVHAIAMCNLAEAVAGLCIEASLPKQLRWIPKGMKVEYLKKAMSNLTATCLVDIAALKPGEQPVLVDVKDTDMQIVFRATIVMYISEKKRS